MDFELIAQIVTGVISVASAIVLVTPSPKDDTALGNFLAGARKFIEVLALNFGNAKDK